MFKIIRIFRFEPQYELWSRHALSVLFSLHCTGTSPLVLLLLLPSFVSSLLPSVQSPASNVTLSTNQTNQRNGPGGTFPRHSLGTLRRYADPSQWWLFMFRLCTSETRRGVAWPGRGQPRRGLGEEILHFRRSSALLICSSLPPGWVTEPTAIRSPYIYREWLG